MLSLIKSMCFVNYGEKMKNISACILFALVIKKYLLCFSRMHLGCNKIVQSVHNMNISQLKQPLC